VTVSSEQFMSAIVALRTAIIRSSRGVLTEEERDRVLAEQGVSPDELRQFVDVHGANVPMMSQLWTEVERRIRERFGPTPPTELDPTGALPDGF
jgi:hypothetical protein